MEPKKNVFPSVELGELPFTWIDVLKSFERGQEKKFPVNGATMVITIRGAIARYQQQTDTQFTTRVSDDNFVYITRVE